jgi:endonuclease/exonuclease/phosphatase family metal-dependent hydrolase
MLMLYRRAFWPLLLATACGVGPIMGFCIPWSSLVGRATHEGLPIRAITINVGQLNDREGLTRFLRDVNADFIAIQEWSASLIEPKDLGPGWYTASEGELFVASRFPILETVASPRGRGRWYSPIIRCVIKTPAGLVHVYCVHLYTLRKGLDAVRGNWWNGVPELKRVTAIRNEESQVSSRFVGSFDRPTLVLGDFNMTSDSAIFQDHWGRWQDAFGSRGFGFGYTFSSRKIGLRIDHALADPAHWHIRSCRVGPGFRGQHRPLVAEFVLRTEE